jgi:secreted PhoX family phosphatase
MKRRDALRLGATLVTGAMVGPRLWRALLAGEVHAAPASECPPAVGGPGPYGPLLPADANGIMLPAGFTSRVVARALQPVAGTGYTWHRFPDGGATFRAPRGGWIYVSNSEFVGPTGASAIRFDRDGTIVDAYEILNGTLINCAGGATPWGTWLSCEEHDNGNVWECDPTGATPGVRRAALGTFRHEAVAVDRRHRTVYLTEDIGDGRFYRFIPTVWRDLSAGVLEAAVVAADGSVTWLPVPAPNDITTPVRHQVPTSTAFRGGEGITQRRGHVYFVTKGDNRVWDYDVRRAKLRVLYEAGLDPVQQLTGVDNICVSRGGDLFVAEDGTTMELVLISADGIASPLLRIVGQSGSEICGPAFDPRRGDRLYFSSQRGDSNGITYEVTGPFRRRGARPIC